MRTRLKALIVSAAMVPALFVSATPAQAHITTFTAHYNDYHYNDWGRWYNLYYEGSFYSTYDRCHMHRYWKDYNPWKLPLKRDTYVWQCA